MQKTVQQKPGPRERARAFVDPPSLACSCIRFHPCHEDRRRKEISIENIRNDSREKLRCKLTSLSRSPCQPHDLGRKRKAGNTLLEFSLPFDPGLSKPIADGKKPRPLERARAFVDPTSLAFSSIQFHYSSSLLVLVPSIGSMKGSVSLPCPLVLRSGVIPETEEMIRGCLLFAR